MVRTLTFSDLFVYGIVFVSRELHPLTSISRVYPHRVERGSMSETQPNPPVCTKKSHLPNLNPTHEKAVNSRPDSTQPVDGPIPSPTVVFRNPHQRLRPLKLLRAWPRFVGMSAASGWGFGL